MKLCPYVNDRYCTSECMAYFTNLHNVAICQRTQHEDDLIEALGKIVQAIQKV